MSQETRDRLHFIVPIVALCALLAGCSASALAGAGGPPAGSSGPAPTATASPGSSPVTVTAPASPAASPAVPVLGQGRAITQGYGSVRPATIDNGGDPTGIVTDVSWQSWGGPQAIGTGTADYDPPNVPVALSTPEQATVVAFDPGTCDGLYMYQAIEWYFPSSGGSFDATSYLNVCSWTYHPSGGP